MILFWRTFFEKMIDVEKILGDTYFFFDQNTYFLLTNKLLVTTPFYGAFLIEKRKTQKIKGARKLEVSSCFALVLEKTKRKGKAILNTTGLFSS